MQNCYSNLKLSKITIGEIPINLYKVISPVCFPHLCLSPSKSLCESYLPDVLRCVLSSVLHPSHPRSPGPASTRLTLISSSTFLKYHCTVYSPDFLLSINILLSVISVFRVYFCNMTCSCKFIYSQQNIQKGPSKLSVTILYLINWYGYITNSKQNLARHTRENLLRTRAGSILFAHAACTGLASD